MSLSDSSLRVRARPSRFGTASARTRLFLSAALVALLSAAAFAAPVPARPVPGTWRERAPEGVRRGDLALRLGSGTWTRHFRQTSTRDPRFSHAGIVVADAPDVWVVHSEANERTGAGGVRRQDWRGFCEPALDCAVWRLSDDPEAAERIARAAEARLGVPVIGFILSFFLLEKKLRGREITQPIVVYHYKEK